VATVILFCLLAALAAVLVIAVTGAVQAARGQPSSAAAEYERRVKARTRTSGRGAAQRPQAPSLPVGDAVLTQAEWD
jgi:hypothetical protein